jgi:hypothetical protein
MVGPPVTPPPDAGRRTPRQAVNHPGGRDHSKVFFRETVVFRDLAGPQGLAGHAMLQYPPGAVEAGDLDPGAVIT